MLTSLLLGASLLSSATGGSGLGQSRPFEYRAISLEQSQDACVCPNTRGLFDVLWGCLSTIFLCTWVSVHPNMSPKGYSIIKKFLRRIQLMFAAVLGPEIVLMFSMRQWLAARQISKEYKARGWTMTHGFFLVMGGFVLRRGDEHLGILSYEHFRELDESGEIEFPSITQDEIEDKSKGDMFSKGLVILQTLWFSIQCIARGVEGLALTELEVVTLAFCSLNAAMYIMWWHKPLDVECPIPVFLKPDSTYVQVSELKRAERIEDVDLASEQIAQALESDGVSVMDAHNVSAHDNTVHKICRSFRKGIDGVRHAIEKWVLRVKKEWHKDRTDYHPAILGPLWAACAIIYLVIWIGWAAVAIIVYPLSWTVKMFFQLLGVSASQQLPPGQQRIHPFFSPILNQEKKDIVIVLYGVTGAIFGGLHLVAWNFDFPTHTECIIWRYLSLWITIQPSILVFGRAFYVGPVADYAERGPDELDGVGLRIIYAVFYLFYFIITKGVIALAFFYFPARFALLLQAFVALRHIPPTSLLNIDWQIFIPHL